MTTAFVDCNNLCYRAYHTTGTLSYGNNLTGVAYGFLNQLFTFLKKAPYGVQPVFCWDSKTNYRRGVYGGYKKREEQTEEAAQRRSELYDQFDAIRTEMIPALGWVNRCWHIEGYEADDLMAVGCEKSSEKVCIIVSGDEDLYQCLFNKSGVETMIFNPGKNEFYRQADFFGEYNISEEYWPQVKALAGELPATLGVPISRLSTADIAREVRRAGSVATISDKSVWRWLHDDAIRPWQHRA